MKLNISMHLSVRLKFFWNRGDNSRLGYLVVSYVDIRKFPLEQWVCDHTIHRVHIGAEVEEEERGGHFSHVGDLIHSVSDQIQNLQNC